MDKRILRIKNTRNFLLNVVKDLSVQDLNDIPPGFNNNIIWNLAHLTAAQQGVCYVRAGVPVIVDEKYIAPYRSGTKPEKNIDENEIEILKQVFLSSLDQFASDCENNLFSNYVTWTTRYGVELVNIDDAIEFLMFHEGLHAGYIMALKRLVKK